jgi:uncharacterized lipoprotein YmbA
MRGLMKIAVLIIAAVTLSGCMITDREATYYTRSEIDAINARTECRMMARTIIQIYRCDSR